MSQEGIFVPSKFRPATRRCHSLCVALWIMQRRNTVQTLAESVKSPLSIRSYCETTCHLHMELWGKEYVQLSTIQFIQLTETPTRDSCEKGTLNVFSCWSFCSYFRTILEKILENWSWPNCLFTKFSRWNGTPVQRELSLSILIENTWV